MSQPSIGHLAERAGVATSAMRFDEAAAYGTGAVRHEPRTRRGGTR